MNFLEMQEDLVDLIGDTSSKWIIEVASNGNGVALRSAVNYGIKQTLDRLNLNALFKQNHYIEIDLTLIDNIATPPTDYGFTRKVFDGETEMFNYRTNKSTGKIEFNDECGIPGAITLQYIPKREVLVAETDEIFFDEYFHYAIGLYAMERYHIKQYDISNAAQSVAYAEDKIKDLINKYH